MEGNCMQAADVYKSPRTPQTPNTPYFNPSTPRTPNTFMAPSVTQPYAVHQCVMDAFSKFFNDYQNIRISRLTLECETKTLRDIINNAIMRLCPVETSTSTLRWGQLEGHWINLTDTKIKIYPNILAAIARIVDKPFLQQGPVRKPRIIFTNLSPIPPDWNRPDIPFNPEPAQPEQLARLSREAAQTCVQYAVNRLFEMGVAQNSLDCVCVTRVCLICETSRMCHMIALILNDVYKVQSAFQRFEGYYKLDVSAESLKTLAEKHNHNFSNTRYTPFEYWIGFRTLAGPTLPQEWVT